MNIMVNKKVKLFIVGHGRHGKDTMAEQLKDDFGLSFADSSMFMAERLVWETLDYEFGIKYETAEECWQDRHNHRDKWYRIISEFNRKDRTRLSREIFQSNQIYVGIRNRDEFLASKHLADLSVWVDAGLRLPPEPNNSMTILREDADIVIENNGSLITFQEKVDRLAKMIGLTPKSELKPGKWVTVENVHGIRETYRIDG